jgi:hypothetical protein
MAQRYDHLRAKAIELRTKHRMTLDEIIERLALPRGTVYYWIKDIPFEPTSNQKEAHRKRAEKASAATKAKHAALREAAYQRGLAEAPELLKDPSFRDFVVLYMAEGTKRHRNMVAFVNSDASMVKLAHYWINLLKADSKQMDYFIQCHVDHIEADLQRYWGDVVGIEPERIKIYRKSNSGKLAGRQFRSEHGLLTVRVSDTYLRARLQAWMDIIKSQW